MAPLIFLLTSLFGMSAWLVINGIWAELPLLVSRLPEGWDLPSIIVIVIQVANVVPIVYSIVTHYYTLSLKYTAYLIILLSTVSCILLSLFWDYTTLYNSSQHSVAFITLIFFVSAASCTSSLVFLPFMYSFPPQYITAYYVGEGMGGVMSSVLGLLQGKSEDSCYENTNSTVTVDTGPLFSVNVYFIIITGLCLCSFLAFFCLNKISAVNTELSNYNSIRDAQAKTPDEEEDTSEKSEVVSSSEVRFTKTNATNEDTEGIVETLPASPPPSIIYNVKDVIFTKSDNISPRLKYLFLLLFLIVTVISALGNGVIPAVKTYACLPYGSLAYHLSVELSLLANPLACFIAMFLPCTCPLILSLLTTLSVFVSSFVIVLAAQSPTPLLYNEVGGTVMIVFLIVLWSALFFYLKVCVAMRLQRYGANPLFWCGVMTQCGSCFGAVVIFLFVNQTDYFTQC